LFYTPVVNCSRPGKVLLAEFLYFQHLEMSPDKQSLLAGEIKSNQLN